MAPKPRLLMLCSEFPPKVGGIQTVQWELAQHFGPDVIVVTGAADGSDRVDAQSKCRVHRVAFTSDRVIPRTLQLVKESKSLLRDNGIRHVLCGHVDWSGAAYQMRLFGGVATGLLSYGNELLALRGGGKAHVYKYFLRHFDMHFPISLYTQQWLHKFGVPVASCHLMPLGVDTERFHTGLDTTTLRHRLGLEGKTVLLTLGRLVERKGHDQVIRALPQVLEQSPTLRYVIAGDGVQRGGLEELARSLGVADAVIFTGPVPDADMPAYYNLCDIFIMPAREIIEKNEVEGFGLVFLEAFACGKPVIAGNSGGIPDAVPPQSGMLVDPLDTGNIANAIVVLATDMQMRRTMGLMGLEWVRQFRTWYQAVNFLDDHFLKKS